MRNRAAVLALLLPLLGSALAACSGDDDAGPSSATTSAAPTTDADCAARIPDGVFTTLGWSAPTPAEATVRGCHREAEQGYVEVRDRTGYRRLCATLDRTGGVAAGVPVDWLPGATACAVEPGTDTGPTRVVVRREGGAALLVTVAVLSSTPREKVRAAVVNLSGHH